MVRVGKYEMEILRLLCENEGSMSFRKIREQITGYMELKWRKISHDKYYEVNRLFKTLSRATRTLEEKGLIERLGATSWRGTLSRIYRLEITEEGRKAYLIRS